MEKTNHLQGRQVSGGGKIIAFLFPFIGVISTLLLIHLHI